MWGEWGLCSATCGSGIKVRFRLCDNPPKLGSGKDCVGENNSTAYCKDWECGRPSKRSVIDINICILQGMGYNNQKSQMSGDVAICTLDIIVMITIDDVHVRILIRTDFSAYCLTFHNFQCKHR